MTAVDAHSLGFARRADRRVVLGVAGGFADQHGLDAIVVRAALVMLSFAGGLGIVVYVLGHLLAETRREPLPAAQPHDHRRNLAVAAIALGLALLMRGTGLWIGDSVMTVIIVVSGGVALLGVLRPPDHDSPDAARRDGASTLAAVLAGRHALWRILAGGALIAVGLVLVGGSGGVSSGLRVGVYATALTILGVTVLLGPWLARTAQEMAAERRQRIRLDEREAMAAHLHDSVLQTLALIQRSADDPRRTITLARRQEAELRQWLYGNSDMAATTLSGALQAMVDEVEDLYDIRIEPVVVGDEPMNDRFAALIAATREACVNAAKHGEVHDVSVYLEVTSEAVEVFVRDRGVGFDVAATTEGQGIAQSIRARLERSGGTVTIESRPGDGTEVRLSVPLGVTVGAQDDPSMTTVFLVDDHALFRAGVRSEIGSMLDLVGEAGTVDDAVAGILAVRPDVSVVDVHLPSGGGKAIIERVLAQWPEAVFLALSVSDAADDVVGVIRAGARGYVTKTIDADQLVDAIRRVHGGDAVFSPWLAGFVLDAFSGASPTPVDPEVDQLTVREQEVMRLIARGYTYREVAAQLHLSVKTVETHVSAVLRKLQLSNRHELKAWATDRRLL